MATLSTNRVANRTRRGFHRSDELTFKKQTLDDLTLKDLKDIRAVVGNNIQDSQVYANALKGLAEEADCSLALYLKVVQTMKEGTLLEPSELSLLHQAIPTIIPDQNRAHANDINGRPVSSSRSPESLQMLENFFQRHPQIKRSGKLNKLSAWNMFSKEHLMTMPCAEVQGLLIDEHGFTLTNDLRLRLAAPSIGDRMRACGVKWKATPASEQKVFVDKALEHNEREREGRVS